MRNRPIPIAVSVFLLVIAATGVMYGNAITGSFPFAGVNVSLSGGTNLKNITDILTATSDVTTGTGTGSFSVIGAGTGFSGFTFDVSTVGSGGGFMISNASFGSFNAAKGSVITSLPTFLNVDLRGLFTPGPGMSGVSPGVVDVNLSFTQNGNSLSASGTLAAIPEVGTMALLGTAILGIAARLRLMKNRRTQ